MNVPKGLLKGNVFFDSINVKPRPDDPEYLIPGLVALSTIEEKGVKLHLGEFLRRLKNFSERSY